MVDTEKSFKQKNGSKKDIRRYH